MNPNEHQNQMKFINEQIAKFVNLSNWANQQKTLVGMPKSPLFYQNILEFYRSMKAEIDFQGHAAITNDYRPRGGFPATARIHAGARFPGRGSPSVRGTAFVRGGAPPMFHTPPFSSAGRGHKLDRFRSRDRGGIQEQKSGPEKAEKSSAVPNDLKKVLDMLNATGLKSAQQAGDIDLLESYRKAHVANASTTAENKILRELYPSAPKVDKAASRPPIGNYPPTTERGDPAGSLPIELCDSSVLVVHRQKPVDLPECNSVKELFSSSMSDKKSRNKKGSRRSQRIKAKASEVCEQQELEESPNLFDAFEAKDENWLFHRCDAAGRRGRGRRGKGGHN